MKQHEKYIKRCLELAKNGLGTTYPNPLVGCVIVYKDKIIGEGWHKKAGEPHAEVRAIHSVKNKSLLCQSTIYVNLEPCSHFGKTPPCSDLIIASKIPNVIVGTIDPFSKVAGTGIQKLTASGKKVNVGILEEECSKLNKRFFTFHTKKRPYIILKWAESQDGFIAPKTKKENKPIWISNEFSRQLVHKWRSEEQAILVGTNTVIEDNPTLTTRDWFGNQPIRIVLDKNNRISKESAIFDNQAPTICIGQNALNLKNNVAQEIAHFLYQKGIQSVLIEGGSQTLKTFIDANLWDEARIFKGEKFINSGTKAPSIVLTNCKKKTLLNDELLIILNHD